MKTDRHGNLLRWVEYFIVVAETGHVSRAAEILGIAQPPLSQTIKKLEAAVGTELFIRHARGVSLSPAGRAFLPRAQSLLDAQQLVMTLHQDLEQAQHRVNVLLPRTLPPSWVSAALLSPPPDFPPAEWAGAASTDIVRAVRENPATVGIVTAPIITDELEAWPVVAVPQSLAPGLAMHETLNKAGLRRAVGAVLLAPPRADGPAAFDVLSAELESAGIVTQLREVADPLRIAAEITCAAATVLVPSGTPNLPASPLASGLLPLRLRVLHHPDAASSAIHVATMLHECLARTGRP